MAKFRYKARTPEQVKKRASQQGGSRDGYVLDEYSVWNPQSNKDSNIRFLPPTWDDPEHYGFDVFVHYGIGADKGSYLCLKVMKAEHPELKMPGDGECPICAARAKAEAKDPEYAKSLAATKRVLAWMIDRNNEDDGPQLWPMPWTLDRDISKLCTDKKTGKILNIDDPDDGYDVTFEREGSGQKTKYTAVRIDRDSSALHRKELKVEEWMEFIVKNPIPECLLFHEAEYIEKVFEGHVFKPEKEEEEDKGKDKEEKGKKDKDGDKDEKKGKEKEKDEKDEKAPDFTWDELHEMKRRKLEKMADDLGWKEKEYEDLDDEELADLMCKELDIKKPGKSSRDKLEELRKKHGKGSD